MRSYIGITVHFTSNLKAANCYVGLQTNPQVEEIASNFEITNKRIFSVAGRMFEPDWCRLPDKRFEALMFINYNKNFKHWFMFNQYVQVFVAVE